MWAEFTFLRPFWLLLLLPLALLLWWLVRHRGAANAWRDVIDSRWLDLLLLQPAQSRSHWPLWLVGLGGVLGTLALANPVWEKLPQPVFQTAQARLLVLDLSLSMYSPDLKPDRLSRARFKLRDILQREFEGQTGLVSFAGDAFVVTPLTRDTETIETMLEALSPSLMPVQGSRADLGIDKAVELMQQAGVRQGQIVLLADDYADNNSLLAAERAAAAGYPVSVIGVGTAAGAAIPNGRGGYIQDRDGKAVKPLLDETKMQFLAQAGGGRYVRLTLDDSDLQRVLDNPMSVADAETAAGMETEKWRENGPWLVLLLVPLAALAFRRGWLLSILSLILLTPPPAQALEFADLWQRPDQRAAQALREGDFARAGALAQEPLLKGSAAYRNEDFAAAADAFGAAGSADALYNLGNALAQQRQFKEALAAYDKALALAPGMPDALHNRELVEQWLQQPPPEPSADASKAPPQQEQQQDPQNSQQGSAGEPGSNSQDSAEAQAEAASDALGAQADSASSTSSAAEPHAEKTEAGETGDPAAEPQAAEKPSDNDALPPTGAEAGLSSEQQMAAEQWLRRIPDDPGELLRRKFQYQYQQRGRSTQEAGTPW